CRRRGNVFGDTTAVGEVTSRILKGLDGFIEVAKVLPQLDETAHQLGLRVNARTGFHLHLGYEPLNLTVAQLKRLVRLIKIFEPALASLVAPSRIAAFAGGRYRPGRPNRFCRPIGHSFPEQELARVSSVRAF